MMIQIYVELNGNEAKTRELKSSKLTIKTSPIMSEFVKTSIEPGTPIKI